MAQGAGGYYINNHVFAAVAVVAQVELLISIMCFEPKEIVCVPCGLKTNLCQNNRNSETFIIIDLAKCEVLHSGASLAMSSRK